MPANWFTLILNAGAIVLAAAGLAVLTRWLIGDRSKGRRRCPKCWYDMSATPGLRCPECGKVAAGERAMFRTHRRHRLVVVGVLLLASASATVSWQVRQRGWMSLMPTTVLLYTAPGQIMNRHVTNPRTAALISRMSEFGVWRWQWRCWIDLQREANRTELIEVPAAWPSDLPLRVRAHLNWLSVPRVHRVVSIRPLWAGGTERRLAATRLPFANISEPIGLLPPAGVPADVEVTIREAAVMPDGTLGPERLCYRDTIRLSVTPEPSLEESSYLLDSGSDPEVIASGATVTASISKPPRPDEGVAAMLHVAIHVRPLTTADGLSLSSRLDLSHEGVAIGSAMSDDHSSPRSGFHHHHLGFQMALDQQALERIRAVSPERPLLIRATIDRSWSISLSHFRGWRQHWTGSFELKVDHVTDAMHRGPYQ